MIDNKLVFLEKLTQMVLVVFLGILTMTFFSLCFALVVWPLWNWLMPELFGLPTVGYWQSFGLCLLSSILFRMSVSWSGGKDGVR